MSKNYRHPHHDIIIAWLDGEDIQMKDGHGRWVTMGKEIKDASGKWIRDDREADQELPRFYIATEYRIKPKNIVVRKHIEYYFDERRGDGCWTPDTKEPNFEFEFDPDTKKIISCRLIGE